MRRPLALLSVPLSALVLTACGTGVSTSAFKGEQQKVAQTIANLQKDATAGDEKKICANDLAAAVVTRLDGSKGCEKAVKSQVAEADSLEVTVQSVTISANTATAKVTSIYSGKHRLGVLALVKEAGKWKVSSVT
jgi:hypothetical protein